MRNIKFRIYFKDEEEFMTKPITIEDLLREDWIDFENEKGTLSLPLKDFRFFYGKNENYEIMQYTGLKDKNGKEIYEGDIVKSYFENGLGAENKCLIIYDEYLCAFMGQELRTKQQYLFNEGNPNKKDKQLKYTEVIGNIYENKNLLEEENKDE